jgi:hypothetical protein
MADINQIRKRAREWTHQHTEFLLNCPICTTLALLDEIERLRANAPLTIYEGECPELDAVVAALYPDSPASGGAVDG